MRSIVLFPCRWSQQPHSSPRPTSSDLAQYPRPPTVCQPVMSIAHRLAVNIEEAWRSMLRSMAATSRNHGVYSYDIRTWSSVFSLLAQLLRCCRFPSLLLCGHARFPSPVGMCRAPRARPRSHRTRLSRASRTEALILGLDAERLLARTAIDLPGTWPAFPSATRFNDNLDGRDLQRLPTVRPTTCVYFFSAGDRVLFRSTHLERACPPTRSQPLLRPAAR